MNIYQIWNMVPLKFLILGLFIRGSTGFGSGAPPRACDGLQPIHNNISPQTSASPYSLSVTDSTDNNGAKFTVRIVSSEPFRGFLLKANTVGALSQNFVGRFSTIASLTQRVCGDTSSRGVTHTSTATKQNVNFVWEPDQSDCNTNIKFYATVARGYTEYWPGLETSSVYVNCTGQSPPQPPPTTSTPTPGAVLSLDSACGTSKGCFHDCQGSRCTYLVSWQDRNTSVEFELATTLAVTGNVWAAIGFSSDMNMGDDSVIACLVNNDVVSVEHSYNVGYSNVPLSDPLQGLTFISGSRQNGIIRCQFLRAKTVAGQLRINDLNQKWHLLFGTGLLNSGFKVKHATTPTPSSQTVDFLSIGSVGGGAIEYPLVKAHGCFMILAWVLFSSIGIVTARYYKTEWPDRTILGLKVWFPIHRACMVSALTCTIIAFIIIFVEVGGYSNIVTDQVYLKAHPVLGIIITILTIANPIMAIFRPSPDHERRPIFNWAHRFVGTFAQGLAALTILFGFELGKAGVPASATYVMIAFIITFLAVEITLEILQCYCKNKGSDTMEMKSNEDGSISAPPSRMPLTYKQVILCIYGIVLVIYTLVLIILVASV